MVLMTGLPCPAETVAVDLGTDSQASGFEAYRAMDGDPRTMWHTVWGQGETKHPHDLLIDLKTPRTISGFAYLPRPGGGNGRRFFHHQHSQG